MLAAAESAGEGARRPVGVVRRVSDDCLPVAFVALVPFLGRQGASLAFRRHRQGDRQVPQVRRASGGADDVSERLARAQVVQWRFVVRGLRDAACPSSKLDLSVAPVLIVILLVVRTCTLLVFLVVAEGAKRIERSLLLLLDPLRGAGRAGGLEQDRRQAGQRPRSLLLLLLLWRAAVGSRAAADVAAGGGGRERCAAASWW